MNTRRMIIIAVVLIVLVGGFFGVRAFTASQASARLAGELQTERLRSGSLQAIVGATGTVRANQSVLLSWQTTGTVAEVNVTLGQQVQEGEVLAALRQSSLPQNLILAQADLVSAQNALEDLLDSYDQLSVALAEQNVATARQRLEDAQEHVDNINYVGSQEEINEAYADLQEAYQDLKAKEAKKNQYSNTNTREYQIAYMEYREAYDVYAAKLGDYNYISGNTEDEIERAISEANLEVAKQQLSDAEQQLADLLDGPDNDDVAAAEARVAAAQAALELAWIESPFAGTITQADPKPGDKVQVGTPVFRVDDLTSLLVDVDVSEVDINRVEVGQPVTLTFDAVLAKEYAGEVVEVSPVGSILAGVVNFKVTIKLLDPDENVKPGMTAAVNIVVSQLEDVLLVPNRAVRVQEGERVVYVLKGGQLEMVTIELGASADLYSELVGGDLKVGDLIVLNPPLEFMNMDGPPPFVRN
ncbi:MAG: efflux RND transporter periplasmic adaptor subunit [Anaerolineales bacterium]|nr:efflux RND transporter periplasmic adaptor subunit [Anaerolineales bacterium]